MLNQTLQIVSMVLCIVGILQVFLGPKLEKNAVFFFVAFYTGNILFSLFILTGLLARGQEGIAFQVIYRISSFGELFMGYFLTFAVNKWLLYRVDPQNEVRFIQALKILSAGLLICQNLLLVLSQFTGFFYEIDSENIYRRGEGFYLLCAFWVVSFFISAFVLVCYGKKLRPKSKVSFWIFGIVSGAAAFLQVLFYGIYFITFSSSVCAVVLIMFDMIESAETINRKEKENERLRVEILRSQIQPHFIFNSLTVIKRFCRRDPELAEKAVTDFSRFLRGNMDSLDSKEPIPFQRELEHTKAYLSLEKFRFGDDLNIEYNIQTTAFLLPPLSLQPIVENAVRHGIRETLDGKGTVTIMTREYVDRNEIIVTDDGTGFDTNRSPDSDKPHIGIENVRYRLKSMCNGSLTIDSAPGQGTVAVITVPKGE